MHASTRLPLASVLALLAFAATARASNPACIKWHATPYARTTGYDHVVTIENGCDKPALCTVSTDVAPDPIQATVPPKDKIELTTFRGSPASTFRAKVDCSLK
jgi:hypothetical protein